MPAILYLNLPEYQGDYRAIPAYVDKSGGLKWVSVYENNWKQNLHFFNHLPTCWFSYNWISKEAGHRGYNAGSSRLRSDIINQASQKPGC